MNRKTSTPSFLAILAVAVCLTPASPLQAVEPCEESESIGDCWRRVYEEYVPPPQVAEAATATAKTDAEATEKSDLAKKPTGQDTGDTTLQTTTKGFLPLAALSALLGQGGEKDDEGNLVFDLNFLLPGGLGGKNSQLQAVVNTEPKLADSVETQLPETSRADLAAKLEDELTSADDVTFSFTYNLQGLNRGRNFEIYRSRYAALTAPFKAQLDGGDPTWIQALLAAREELRCDALRDEEDFAGLRFSDIADRCKLSKEQATAGRRRLAEAAAAFADPVARLRAHLIDFGLDRFAALVHNQRQLHLSAKRRERDALAGGDATTAKVTYEWARVNFKSAMSADCHRRLDRADPDPQVVKACAEEYKRYVATHAAEITEGERFSFAFEYEDIDETTVPLATLLPDAGSSDLTLPGGNKRIGSLGYSRNFASGGGEPIRLDVVTSYEDVSDDPSRRDRFVATATVTRRVGGFVVPLGVVYANHGEYLGEVDKRLSAHVGLKFDLAGDSK